MTTTLVVTLEPGSSPPRVKLDLTWTGATSATIVRHDPDGRTRTVRSANPASLSSDTWSGYDYECPFGVEVTYEAQVGTTSVTNGPNTLSVSVPWLIHTGSPSLSLAPDLSSDGEPVYALNRAVFTPLGRQYPIVVTDGTRRAKSSALEVRTWTLDEREAWRALLADGSTLLLNVPPALGWGITWQYISPGDLREKRLAEDVATVPYRSWSLPYDETDTPPTATQPAWNYAGVLIDNATYSAVKSNYASYQDLLNNVRVGTVGPPPVTDPDGTADITTYIPDPTVPRTQVYSVSVNGADSFVYSTFDNPALAQPHWGKFTTFSMGNGSASITITTNYDVSSVIVRPLIQNVQATVVDSRHVKLTLYRPGNYSVEFNANPLQTDQTKPGSTDQLDPLFIFASPLEVKPQKTDPTVYAYFSEGGIYTGGSVVPGNGATITVPSSGDLVVPANKKVYIEGGAIFKGRLICGATNATDTGADGITVDGRGIVDATWQATPGNPVKVYKCTNTTVSNIVALSCQKWAFRVFGSGSQSAPVTVKGVRVLSWADPAKAGGRTPDGIDVLASSYITIDGAFVRSRDDGICMKNSKNNFNGDWAGDTHDVVVKNCTVWNGDAGNSLEIGWETGAAPYQVYNITYQNIDIIHKTKNPAQPLTEMAQSNNRAAISIHNQSSLGSGTGGGVHNISYSDIRCEDIIGDAGQTAAGKDGMIYINSSASNNANPTDNIYFKDISFVHSQAALAIQVRGGDSTHRVTNVTFENVINNGVVLADNTIAANNLFVSSNVTNVVFIPSQASGSTGTTLSAVADAWVRNDGTQSGSEVYLRVKNSSNNTLDRKSFIRFDATSTGFTSCTKAVLRLWRIGNDLGVDTPISVYGVTDDTWTETGITWVNAPALGSLLTTTTIGTQQQYYEWNLTAFVNAQLGGDQIVSVAVWDPAQADNQVTFSSREAVANNPVLVVSP